MLRCVARLLLSGDALGGALVPLGALFFGGGGKPSQADNIPVDTGNVDLSIARSGSSTPSGQ